MNSTLTMFKAMDMTCLYQDDICVICYINIIYYICVYFNLYDFY